MKLHKFPIRYDNDNNIQLTLNTDFQLCYFFGGCEIYWGSTTLPCSNTAIRFIYWFSSGFNLKCYGLASTMLNQSKVSHMLTENATGPFLCKTILIYHCDADYDQITFYSN